jgi:hypothetical protein
MRCVMTGPRDELSQRHGHSGRRAGCRSPVDIHCRRLNFFSCSLRFLSFIRSQDSIANGALVIARLQLATGIRPVGRKAHNDQ